MNDIFAIYPKDESSSTSFLNRIHTFESSKLGNRWHCYKVHFSDEDHSNCIKQSQQYRFIIFMGHGGETHLHGSCAKYGEMKVDVTAGSENQQFYEKESFIDANNIHSFNGKVFFCFSCNSNRNTPKSLARKAIEVGVKSFVGFGDIPTDYISGSTFSKRCISIYKGKIVKIIKHALYYSIDNNETVFGLVLMIKLLTCKEIQSLRQKAPFHGQVEVIQQLYKFKDEIRIFGDKYSRLY